MNDLDELEQRIYNIMVEHPDLDYDEAREIAIAEIEEEQADDND